MIRIAISVEAFDAIARTMRPRVGYEARPTTRGERTVWLAPAVVDRLGAMRGPGEDYSSVIMRLVETEPRERVRKQQ